MKKLLLLIPLLLFATVAHAEITKSLETYIEVLPDGQMQIKDVTVYSEDGVEVARKNHRRVVAPDMDVTEEVVRVKAIANSVWTKDVKDKYKAKRDALNQT